LPLRLPLTLLAVVVVVGLLSLFTFTAAQRLAASYIAATHHTAVHS